MENDNGTTAGVISAAERIRQYGPTQGENQTEKTRDKQPSDEEKLVTEYD